MAVSVDLDQVQEAAKVAHQNLLAAIQLNGSPYQAELTGYIDEFLRSPVDRPTEVRRGAERSRERIDRFGLSFTSLVSDINLALLERDQLLASATIAGIKAVMDEMTATLDAVTDRILRTSAANQPKERKALDGTLDQIRSDAGHLGNAVAVLEQRGADLINHRLDALGNFCEFYLQRRTTIQAIRDLDSKEIIEILYMGLGPFIDILSPIKNFKKISDMWHQKTRPRAGFKPGDTDVMFILDDILSRDADFMEQLLAASKQVRAHADVLRANVDVVLRGGLRS